jgi:HlyD family secretion protein
MAACAEEQSEAPIYDTATVDRRTIEVSVSSAGVVEPLAIVEVKSKASGEILDLHIETGDLVTRDTLIVQIDPRTVRNRLAQSEAESKAAQSRLDIARTQMERARRLVVQGTYTEADVEQAMLDLANAEAQVVTAQVSVENARIAVDDTDVRAPITGTITFKPVEEGQVISSPTQDFAGGTLLMQMADLSAVQIRALVDETDIGKIRPGMQAVVSVAAYPNQPFEGEVVKIEPMAVIEQNVTMFAVLISLQNPDGLLLPGMNAEVEVSIARSADALTVPVMALRTRRDIATTAGILGMTAEELAAQVGTPGGSKQPPEARARRPSTERGGRPRRADQGNGAETTDFRFGGDFWVVVSEEGRTEIRNVRTGITDLDRVEIVEGLDEAETVLVLPSSHLVETQQNLQRFLNRRIGTVPGISR